MSAEKINTNLNAEGHGEKSLDGMSAEERQEFFEAERKNNLEKLEKVDFVEEIYKKYGIETWKQLEEQSSEKLHNIVHGKEAVGGKADSGEQPSSGEVMTPEELDALRDKHKAVGGAVLNKPDVDIEPDVIEVPEGGHMGISTEQLAKYGQEVVDEFLEGAELDHKYYYTLNEKDKRYYPDIERYLEHKKKFEDWKKAGEAGKKIESIAKPEQKKKMGKKAWVAAALAVMITAGVVGTSTGAISNWWKGLHGGNDDVNPDLDPNHSIVEAGEMPSQNVDFGVDLGSSDREGPALDVMTPEEMAAERGGRPDYGQDETIYDAVKENRLSFMLRPANVEGFDQDQLKDLFTRAPYMNKGVEMEYDGGFRHYGYDNVSLDKVKVVNVELRDLTNDEINYAHNTGVRENMTLYSGIGIKNPNGWKIYDVTFEIEDENGGIVTVMLSFLNRCFNLILPGDQAPPEYPDTPVLVVTPPSETPTPETPTPETPTPTPETPTPTPETPTPTPETPTPTPETPTPTPETPTPTPETPTPTPETPTPQTPDTPTPPTPETPTPPTPETPTPPTPETPTPPPGLTPKGPNTHAGDDVDKMGPTEVPTDGKIVKATEDNQINPTEKPHDQVEKADESVYDNNVIKGPDGAPLRDGDGNLYVVEDGDNRSAEEIDLPTETRYSEDTSQWKGNDAPADVTGSPEKSADEQAAEAAAAAAEAEAKERSEAAAQESYNQETPPADSELSGLDFNS